jgi:hypothetical protein
MIKVGVVERLFLTAGMISATGKSKELGLKSGMEHKNTMQNLDSRILLIQKKSPQEKSHGLCLENVGFYAPILAEAFPYSQRISKESLFTS